MDMRKKLGKSLSGQTLHAMGDRYEGIIAAVEDKALRNRFTTRTEIEPVIEFEDGMQIVLNRGMRYELIERFGPESDDWIGKPLVVSCRRVERTDSKTGELIVAWQKFLP